MVEWMLEDAARAYDFRYVALRYFNVAGADPQGAARPVDAERDASHQARRADRARAASEHGDFRRGLPDPRRHLRARLHPGQRPRSTRISRRSPICARGGASIVCNCGYGHGATVKEVIEVVKRVSGVDFAVNAVAARAGDPAVIVARADRVREVLGWRPQRDDLDDIVRQALEWERRLHNRQI